MTTPLDPCLRRDDEQGGRVSSVTLLSAKALKELILLAQEHSSLHPCLALLLKSASFNAAQVKTLQTTTNTS
ncbi:MAG: hypothetical protein WA777_17950, partial [Rhodanobacter sp.]